MEDPVGDVRKYGDRLPNHKYLARQAALNIVSTRPELNMRDSILDTQRLDNVVVQKTTVERSR